MADVSPWRGEVSFCFVAGSAQEASAMFERAQDELGKCGLFVQGGFIGPMARQDVIPDSPLAEALQ